MSTEQTAKAQKYIKWAGSALNYDDIPTSVLNLQKALHLLTTGKDPAWKGFKNCLFLTKNFFNEFFILCIYKKKCTIIIFKLYN